MAFTSITPAKLAQAAITTSNATIYTVPAITRALVKCIDIANTTAGPVNVTVNLVPSGGTAGAANALIPGVAMAANTAMHWDGFQVMNAADFISVIASATGCTVTISGGEAT